MVPERLRAGGAAGLRDAVTRPGWTRFNGDPSLLGKTFVLNGTARTLVGIMPPRFGWVRRGPLHPAQSDPRREHASMHGSCSDA